MVAVAYKPLESYSVRAEEIAKTLESDPPTLALYRRVAACVDPARVVQLQHKYATELAEFDPIGIYKYADLPFWLADKVIVAKELGLDKGRPRTILDIGMGAGHFAAVCQALGHTVVGTDIAVPLYDDICKVLQVDRRIEPTRRRELLPPLGKKFDFVTVIWQVFHITNYLPDGGREHWTPNDWAFFLNDLIANHMSFPGSIFLYLNANVGPDGEAFDAPLLDWSRSRGAKVDEARGRVLFDPIEGPDVLSRAATT